MKDAPEKAVPQAASPLEAAPAAVPEDSQPAHPATPPETAAREERSSPARSYGRRVASAPTSDSTAKQDTVRNCLLVDDSRMIRKVARQIIERRGYIVSEAENGEEALNKCKRAMPDLVILDWDMPVMTGIEFLSALRALDDGKRSKVVFCTTHSGVKDVHKAVEAGADEYVTKPFDEVSLVTKLKNIGAA